MVKSDKFITILAHLQDVKVSQSGKTDNGSTMGSSDNGHMLDSSFQ
jgi:hypothetical protein